jgi:hypothetical protein
VFRNAGEPENWQKTAALVLIYSRLRFFAAPEPMLHDDDLIFFPAFPLAKPMYKSAMLGSKLF